MSKPGCCVKQGVAWSKEEDGEGNCHHIPQAEAEVKRGSFAEDEEDLVIKLHALLGNRWSLIAGRLPGRSGNEVEKYWNSHLRTKLVSMGIDPENHRPTAPAPTGTLLYYDENTASTSTSTSTCAAKSIPHQKSGTTPTSHHESDAQSSC